MVCVLMPESKVYAIVHIPPPDGKPALRRLLGLVKYLAETLQALLNVIREVWPQHRSLLQIEIRPFWRCKEEIHEAEGLLFRGDAIITPAAMRREIRFLLHEAHLGIEKTKTRACNLVYWLGINSDIEEMVAQ